MGVMVKIKWHVFYGPRCKYICRNVLASGATGHENLSGAIIILYSSTVFCYFS